MATVWLDQQTSTFITQNSLVTLKPIITKRKRTDHDNISNKRKIVINSTTLNDNDDYERLSLSPKMPPIISKITKSSHHVNRSLSSSITLFRCQLCRRYLKNKDNYMDHMTICANQRQASIKIIRAEKDKNEVTIL